MPQAQVPSTAGIVESKTGERHIPSSFRADGTKRKEIRIRPGFKPIEDVEVYKNRSAELSKADGKREVPGAQGLNDSKSKNMIIVNKNTKKRAAKKKLKLKEEEAYNDTTGETLLIDFEEKPLIDLEDEKKKKARNLKKKIKQAKELAEKRDDGSVLLPEQLTKILRINELIRELNALELHSETKKNEDNKKLG